MTYTILCSGERKVIVPMPLACELKHFINKFRVKVVDVLLTPLSEHNEISIYVERLSKRRRFHKAMKRLGRRFARKYGYDIVIIEE